MDDLHRSELTSHLRGWIPLESREKNPTYVRLVEAVIEDEELLQLAGTVPAPQLPANVLFASVHFLLLQGANHPLGLHYPTVRLRHGLTAEPTSSLEADFLDFTRTFGSPLADLLATGITQTNEVARSAILSAVLCDLSADGMSEVALLDAGCSAGLNLFVDAFHIDHSAAFSTGPVHSPITVKVDHQGRVPSGRLPTIRYRVGLDQQPLDPSNPRDATWLEACLWPDDPSRFTRLQEALTLASSRRSELDLHEGDLARDLPRVAATIPSTVPLVIFSSWAAAYLRPGEHEAMTHSIDALASDRTVVWVSCEHPTVAAALGLVPEAFRTEWPGASLVTRRTCGEDPTTVVVGEAHPHAAWINLA